MAPVPWKICIFKICSLKLTHEQLENLQQEQKISLDRTENKSEHTMMKENTSVKKGDKVKRQNWSTPAHICWSPPC